MPSDSPGPVVETFPLLSVLLVDDELMTQEMYAEFLERAGLLVLVARSGAEALTRASEQRPDVIVTDLMLPGMNGYELVRRLREEPQTVNIPVIILTGRGEPAMADRAAQLGCAFLLKPCLPETLLEMIRAVNPTRRG